MEIEEQTAVLERDVKEKEEILNEGTRVQLIVFKLGGEEYALPIDQIKEIVLTPRISKVPQTPEYVLGIANIRGNVISIMDFEIKFGLKKLEAAVGVIPTAKYTLVIESSEFNIGIQVNEVPNTLTVMSSKIDSSSNIMQYSSMDESVIKGVAKIKGRMIILIDVLKMMDLGELKTKL